MATTLNVLNGDISTGEWTVTGTSVSASMRQGNKVISLNKLTSVYQVSEILDPDVGGAAACGVFGGVLFGPLGALAGAALGGTRKQITFQAHFKNGDSFTGVIEKSKWPGLVALANN